MTTRVQGSIKNKRVATELQVERDRLDFDQQELGHIFESDQVTRDIAAEATRHVETDPNLRLTEKYYEMTPQEKLEMWFKKLNYLWHNYDRDFYFQKSKSTRISPYYSHHGQAPGSLHYAMFIDSVYNFASDEQLKKWKPLIENHKILGCYAQTELGHGSNVAGLETTAVYDVKTGEFDIHTPTESATKWWPGDVGLIANYAIVFAQLKIPDEDGELNTFGVAPFLVQIRDLKTHRQLPGIECGHMGPKMGFNSKDNGWLIMNHVKIPREQMLDRYMKLDREGTLSFDGDIRMLYSVMMGIRNHIVTTAKYTLAMGLTIGIRYSLVRRQFRNVGDKTHETQLLDYQTQQFKLLPILATAFGHALYGDHLDYEYKQMMEQAKQGDFNRLDLIHHLACGGKAVHSQEALDGLFVIRQSVGGAGFTAWSGIPRLIDEYSPAVTFEGDNTVMLLQTINYFVKLAKKAMKKKVDAGELDSNLAYLNALASDEWKQRKCTIANPKDFMDLDKLYEALEMTMLHKLQSIIDRRKQYKLCKKDLINSIFAVDILNASTNHVRFLTFQLFRKRVTQGPFKCQKVKEIMTQLCTLYGLSTLNNETTAGFEAGYFTDKNTSAWLLEAIKRVNLQLRPQVLNIIESIPVSDMTLMSAIGNKYGDIYETHLEWAKNSRMNKSHHGDAIPNGYLEYMVPMRDCTSSQPAIRQGPKL